MSRWIDGDHRNRHDLTQFLLELGVAMNSSEDPSFLIQDRLTGIARAYGEPAVSVNALPTYLMLTMDHGEPAVMELSTLVASARLDQISALDRLVQDAMTATISPADGLRRLAEIEAMKPRFGTLQTIAGYSVLTLGLCLILQPARREVAAAAALGAVVGALRSIGRSSPTVQALMPLFIAFVVSALSALAVRADLLESGLRPIVASLVVFLPGAALTTAVLELTSGQSVAGSARLISGVMQLGLLTFGIIGGIEAAGERSVHVFAESGDLLGGWTRVAGVVVFAIGVMVAHSTPPRSFLGLIVVLGAA